MSAPEEVGMAADADALNLADEVRRILADGQPRTTRQIADLSRLTQGGDDVSKTVYLLRMRGEVQTDVVDGARQHRLIPGGIRPPREPARPTRPVGARHASPSRAATPTEDSARGRASHNEPSGSGAPPRMPEAAAMPGGVTITGNDLALTLSDRGLLVLLVPDRFALTLDRQDTQRLADFLARTMAVWSPDPEPAP